ncbi:hypothetical protein [Desulfococcus sp.]|uniref:DUF7450 family protein n=1 Tax=Desulfococcus sp. TaxID=2025834 RepID=UPI003593D3ED
MKKTIHLISILAAGLLSLLMAGCPKTPPPVQGKLDHFKIYLIKEIEIERDPSLMGQFDRKPDRVTLDKIVWFANPVSKNKMKIIDENAHFLGYSFLQEQPRREVEFSNQFGQKQQVTI